MPLSRRKLLGAAGLALLGAGCAGPAPRLPGPPPAPAAPTPSLDTVEGLLAWIREHPQQASLLVDDGRAGRLERRADTPRPVGSASKVVHLTAYARAITSGRLDPAATVPVREWERWYLPYTDGGAHPAALAMLGATATATVTWDQLVRAMIVADDRAAADLLQAELGDDALVEVAAAAGWSPLDVPSYLGELLLVTVPERAGEPRREVAAALAREFADGRPIKEIALEASSRALADDAAVRRWAAGTPSATVRQLTGLHLAAATGRLASPEVAEIVRRHLELTHADRLAPNAVGATTLGASLHGALAYVSALRRTDGSVGVAALSLDGLTAAEDGAFGAGAAGRLVGRLIQEPILLAHSAATLP